MTQAYKIERFLNPQQAATRASGHGFDQHREIMDSLQALHGKLDEKGGDRLPDGVAGSIDGVEQHDTLLKDIEDKQRELMRLREEMRTIYLAIDDTKKQILTIKETGAEGEEIARVAHELSAIVKGTEEATETILHSAETIEGQATNLVACLRDESQQAMACEIQENVVNIFEACNFQDLTGQRITKVVKTFCFIEARIFKMMDIWGGAEAFLNIDVEQHEGQTGDKALLNGPALEQDDSIASQDDIDALFD